MALPLLLEGDLVGMLVAGRRALDAFGPDELQRAKAVASFTAATLQRVLRHEQLNRYATLLERVVDVDQRAFRGKDYSNDEKLGDELFRCGMETGDRAWPMPLWDDYLDQLKSNFADLSNLGGRPAGSVTAACFLGKFTGKFKWAHLDIAGTASVSGADKGATGRPVPLLSEFLIRRAEGRAHA